VFVRNGTATVGGTGYSTAGTVINRIYHSGAWANYVSGSTTLAISTTPITGGTVGRVLFEGTGNVLQENSGYNFDAATGSQIIGGATARGTRQTIVNSANTYATKIFVQRNAADSSDYTSLRGDGVWDFNNVPNTATVNALISAAGSTLLSIMAQPGNRIIQFGFTNTLTYTGGATNNTNIVGSENSTICNTGANFNSILGNTNVIRNCSNSLMLGNYIEISGASRTTVIGGRATTGSAKIVSGNDVTIIGYALESNTLSYTASLTTYFNNANASHWLHQNGNIGLFGKAYTILTDSGIFPLNNYMNLTATNTLTIHNGTATTGSIANAVQVYAADQTAGNSTLFVRSENNDIVKIYSIGGWGTPTGTLTRTTFATYAGATAGVLYDQTIMQTLIDAVKTSDERLAALISDLKTGQQLLKA